MLLFLVGQAIVEPLFFRDPVTVLQNCFSVAALRNFVLKLILARLDLIGLVDMDIRTAVNLAMAHRYYGVAHAVALGSSRNEIQAVTDILEAVLAVLASGILGYLMAEYVPQHHFAILGLAVGCHLTGDRCQMVVLLIKNDGLCLVLLRCRHIHIGIACQCMAAVKAVLLVGSHFCGFRHDGILSHRQVRKGILTVFIGLALVDRNAVGIVDGHLHPIATVVDLVPVLYLHIAPDGCSCSRNSQRNLGNIAVEYGTKHTVSAL